MQIDHTSHLDGVSNGLLTKLDRRKWDWLTLQLVFALLISLVLVAKSAATPAYPLKPSANGRYVVDNNNVPFLIIGDAPHSLIVNLNNTDATTYLTSRGSNGFNALWIELLCDSYTGGPGTDGSLNYGHDINGNNPFLSTLSGGYYDLTTPNSAYWAHVDFIVQTAAAHGLQCQLTPLDQGGWTQTSLANGTTRCNTYGQFLGNRYKNSPNIIWNLGNDFNWSNPSQDAAILAIADGIKSTDPNHLLTVQLDASLPSDSQADPQWISRITLNGIYSYNPTYDGTLMGYNRPTVYPVVFLEGHYEGENVGGEIGTPNVLRRQEYWSLIAGSLAGHMWGNAWWNFSANWQLHLASTGTTQLMYFKGFFQSLPWYNLVPDQSHSMLTGGYGTYSTTGNVSANDYATGAATADGTLAVIYTPVAHTLAVALSGFAGPVAAQWYDPTNNTYSTVSGSPFNNSGTHNFATPGNNHAGDPDWVLLLQTEAGSPPGNTCHRQITVNHTLVPSTQTNFPVLINVTDPGLRSVVNGGNVQSNVGYDIRPYLDPDLTTPLAYELDTYGGLNGGLRMWVKLPSLSSVSDTVFYLRYGDATLTTNGSDGAATFANNYVAVYHMGNGSTLVGTDSTGGNDGTLTNGPTAGAGQIGGAGVFTQTSNQQIDLANPADFPVTTPWTLSGWCRPLTTVSGDRILTFWGQTSLNGVNVTAAATDIWVAGFWGGSDLSGGFGTVDNGAIWQYIVVTFDGTVLRAYKNGSLTNTSGPVTPPSVPSTPTAAIGGRYQDVSFNGRIDEVRISSVARSAAWIAAEYNNQNSPGAFITMGSESCPSATPTPTATPTATPTP